MPAEPRKFPKGTGIALLVLSLLTGLLGQATARAATAPISTIQPLASRCPALQFVGVRGSGERSTHASGYGATVNAVRQAVMRAVPGTKAAFVEYPAIPVLNSGLIKDIFYAPRYVRSVEAGKSALRRLLVDFHDRCSDTPIVLVGYSQGAHVAGDVYQDIRQSIRDKIVAMALIADPRFNRRQPQVNFGYFDQNLSGIFPGSRRFRPSEFSAVHSYCRRYDPVCNDSLKNATDCFLLPSFCVHIRYIEFGYPADAANWILSRVPPRSRWCAAQIACRVAGWGSNVVGELGNGTRINALTPVGVSRLSRVTAIAASFHWSLALRSDGSVWTWGAEASTPVDVPPYSSTPVRVRGLSEMTAIAAGGFHGLALRRDGTVWAWGYNGFGQLGVGTRTNSSTPVRVRGLSRVTAIAAGEQHSLALEANGTVRAWGYNYHGQLGNGTTAHSSTPVRVSGLAGVTAIAAAPMGAYSLALRRDGSVRAWGANYAGQLGNGLTTPSLTPVRVGDLSEVTAIAAGQGHGLALRADGTVRAWGYNGGGQLGNGTLTNSSTPVQVEDPVGGDLADVTVIAAGDIHSLALRGDGTVWVWGDNDTGQLGNGTTISSSTPVKVGGLSDVAAIAGGSWHSLALDT
jgi:alpha-tubulin suppressor-like RCC1 family protein